MRHVLLFLGLIAALGSASAAPATEAAPGVIPASVLDSLGCGTLLDPQAADCFDWLWVSEQWGRLLLPRPPGYSSGQVVMAIGTVDPYCWSVCQFGDGCLLSATLSPCEPSPVLTLTWGNLKSRY